MKAHADRNGNTLTEANRVLIDNKWHATVVTAGADRSLLSHARSDDEPGEEHAWYNNTRLTIFTAQMQSELSLQQLIDELQRSHDEALQHWQEQLNASYL